MSDEPKIRKPFNTTAAASADPAAFIADTLVFGQTEAIEMQERQGQAELLESYALPVEMKPSREAFEQLGFRFDPAGPMRDDTIFIAARLPEGWTRRGSDHALWTYIDDEHGVQQVAVFYKAAFYDRHAFMQISRR